MTFMYEKEFTNIFVQKLIAFGYPPESIILDYKIKKPDGYGIIDIAVVDIVTSQLLSIFELKMYHEHTSYKQIKQQAGIQLQNYINTLKKPELLAYFVIAKSAEDFEIYPYTSDDNGHAMLLPPVSLHSLTPYTVLSSGNRVSALQTKSKQIKRTVDWFKIICWLCAVVVTVLAICDYIGYLSISATQLALISIAIALTIIPFSAKLKILGIEFERLTVERKNKKPK